MCRMFRRIPGRFSKRHTTTRCHCVSTHGPKDDCQRAFARQIKSTRLQMLPLYRPPSRLHGGRVSQQIGMTCKVEYRRVACKGLMSLKCKNRPGGAARQWTVGEPPRSGMANEMLYGPRNQAVHDTEWQIIGVPYDVSEEYMVTGDDEMQIAAELAPLEGPRVFPKRQFILRVKPWPHRFIVPTAHDARGAHRL